MNANELADELESIPAYRNIPMFQRVATMLRQQQAEIDALREEREGLCVFCENRALSKKAQEK